MTTLALVGVWIAGLRFLWRSERPLWRALAWAYGLLFVFFAVTTGAKIYYLAGAYIYLLAAGAWPSTDGWRPGRAAAQPAAGHRPDHRRSGANRPAGAAARRHRLDPQGEPATSRIHRLAAARQHRPPGMDLPAAPAAGQRGDLHLQLRRGQRHQRTGPGTGLPQAVSGHNTYWWWGPGHPRATTVLAVMPGPVDGGGDAAYLRQFFTSVRVGPRCPTPTASTIRNGAATFTCAPGPATRGPRCGRGYATYG